MRFLFLPFPKDSLQFGPVRGNHFFLNLRSLNDYRNLIVVGADESLPALKLGNGPHLRPSELESFLHMLRFIRLQIQNNLILRVVDDGSAIPSVLQTKEI